MIKINTELKLNHKSYIPDISNKNKIVFGNLYTYDLLRYIENTESFSASYTCPHYSIDYNGDIYQHIDTMYISNYIEDKKSITVGVLNIGQVFENGQKRFDIYNNMFDGEFERKDWKGCQDWQIYGLKQISSAVKLSTYLLDKHNIEKNVQDINVLKPDMQNFKGVCYRSNFDVKYYDLSPLWPFTHFKNKIENG